MRRDLFLAIGSLLCTFLIICPPWQVRLLTVHDPQLAGYQRSLPWPNPSFSFTEASPKPDHAFTSFVTIFDPPRPGPIENVGFWVVSIDLVRLGLMIFSTLGALAAGFWALAFLDARRAQRGTYPQHPH